MASCVIQGRRRGRSENTSVTKWAGKVVGWKVVVISFWAYISLYPNATPWAPRDRGGGCALIC